MAGVKGKSGGARPNSGGARPGSGRKPKESPIIEVPEGEDPKRFLLAVMNDNGEDARLRIDAAKALMPYMHQKVGEVGKKEERAEAAKKVSGGRFGAAQPPRLVASNGR